MGHYVIETKELTKAYGKQLSVDHLNIHVPKGKIYALLGRNGAGKTTTMKLLLNLAAPTSGEIFLFGTPYNNFPTKTYRRIGAIIETPSFYENLTAAENLEIIARLRGKHKRNTINDALGIVGLDTAGKKIVKEYSLGMKQRLGIAAAIMHEPELLILDEPINGLDPVGIHEIREFLLSLCTEKGTTILISSHVLGEIEQMADIIGVMHEGHLLEETSMPDLHKHNRKYVEFHVSNVNKAACVVEQKFHISDYMIMDHRTIRLFERTEQSSDINSSFVKNDISVTGINQREETLEDYFCKLIGGDGIA